MRPPVFGIAGWKNSGKTTMAARLVTELTGRGYAITAIKHAHESFDIDHPGRDSYRLRGRRPKGVLSSPSVGLMLSLAIVGNVLRASCPKLEPATWFGQASSATVSEDGNRRRAAPRGSRSLACRKLSRLPRTGLAMRPSPSLSSIWTIYEEFRFHYQTSQP
jgi:hypothetical protein